MKGGCELLLLSTLLLLCCDCCCQNCRASIFYGGGLTECDAFTLLRSSERQQQQEEEEAVVSLSGCAINALCFNPRSSCFSLARSSLHCSFFHWPMHLPGALLDMACLPRRSSPLLPRVCCGPSRSSPSRRRRRHRDHHRHSVPPSPRSRDVVCVLGSIFIRSFHSRRYVSARGWWTMWFWPSLFLWVL